MARKDINIDILIKEFVEDNISIRKLVKKYRCRNDYISNLLKSTNDQRVLNKLRKCNEILDYKNGTIGVIACNTNNIFIFPSYLYDIFKKHKWYENKHGYLVRNNYNKIIFAHHFVTGCPLKGFVVDHIDGNPQNNLENNLRIITQYLNCHNARLKKTNSTGYKGITYNKVNKKWVVAITIGGMTFSLGCFKNKEEAALRYLDVKYNLLGFDYMTNLEIEQYNELLTSRAKKRIYLECYLC